MANPPSTRPTPDRTEGWSSRLAVFVGGLIAFETLSGLSIWLLPFSVPNQILVLLHTVAGLLFVLPFAWYQLRHWRQYRNRAWSHYGLTGYVAAAAVLVAGVSGLVLTAQGLFGTAMSYAWDAVHIVATVALMAFLLPHVVLLVLRDRKGRSEDAADRLKAEIRWIRNVMVVTAAGLLLALVGSRVWRPSAWTNEFPADYEVEEGRSPFSPSLATTSTGGAYDERSLSGSESCGTARCHREIYEEWSVSAHRWSSMDPAFQVIQNVMASQNGPASTRYCGGCHDPISLFAGTKNVFTDELSSLHGYNEGVSCLVCHSVRETDLQGNAAYVIAQPDRYLFELNDDRLARSVSDFLIRTYPRHHVEVLSKRLFKTPEYCAACHKQFIDQEVNDVGWVQLQNQYDNWRKSRWNPEGEPDKVVECRECHMPLLASTDPASGDDLDSYRTPDDGKHRDHRFIAANAFVPELLGLPGWEEHKALTEKWLRGEREIPEIAYKWTTGPAVSLTIQAPDTVRPGDDVDIRVTLVSNKVGHDFPTGPLDIIQSWVHLEVTDDAGAVLLSSGAVDEKHFIAPGAFMLKAEPVDRYGNLIDRHNLWEMVGVRFRRALFPGYSDMATYRVSCDGDAPDPTALAESVLCKELSVAAPRTGALHVEASLDYRKIDQYLLNYVFGEGNELTTPVVRMATDAKTIVVARRTAPPDRPGA